MDLKGGGHQPILHVAKEQSRPPKEADKFTRRIFRTDKDRLLFLETLAESCQKNRLANP